MTLDEVASCMDVLVAAWPRTQVSDETLVLYAAYLTDCTFEHGMGGVVLANGTTRGFPSLGELRAAVSLYRGDAPPDADRAWGEVMRRVESVGAYRSPVFTHPAIADVVRSLSWREICACEVNQLSTLRAQFTRAYEAAMKRETVAEHRAIAERMISAVKSGNKLGTGQARRLLGGK